MEVMAPFLNALLTNGERFGQRVAERAREVGVDGLICGHFHRVAIHEEFGAVYGNCGDWLDGCTAIAEEADGRLKIVQWKTAFAGPISVELASGATAHPLIGS